MLNSRYKRSCFDTICEILKTCNTGDTTVHILLQTHLDEGQLMKYMATLVRYGLLEAVENGCRTTERGRRFIERFEELHETLEQEA